MAHPTTSGRLADKVAIITGSSSGLGRAIALAFAANGAGRIICSDLREDARGTLGVPNADVPTHELICQQYGEKKAVFVQADMTKAEDVEGLVRSAVNVGGRLDVMINNAGYGGAEVAGKIHNVDPSHWDFVMSTNARSVFLGCKNAIRQFLAQRVHPSRHKGWIINTASILGLVGQQPAAGAYCASKGAVVLLTKQIAVEYAKEKVHCNALCPGYTKSPMTEPQFADKNVKDAIDSKIPWGEWGQAEDVAKCAVFLASDDASYVTGHPLVVDGGYTAQ